VLKDAKGSGIRRSRGGFSTKIHLKTDFDGRPIAFDFTGDETGDAPHFTILLGLGPDVDSKAVVADKSYARKTNRQAVRSRGIISVIPRRANEKGKRGFFAKAIYKGRARIELAVGELKRFKRVALRWRRRSATSHPSSRSQRISPWSNPSTLPRNAPQASHEAPRSFLAAPMQVRAKLVRRQA
jgi:transposase